MTGLVVKSTTPSDGTFSASGAAAWDGGMTESSGQLTPAHGGTGIDGSAAANGELLIGNGSGYTKATLTPGSNVTITNGPGGITIAASSGSNSGPTFPGGIPLTGVKYPHAYGINLSTGDNDVYTVPANKRALITGWFVYNNSGVGNIVCNAQVKIAGTYYRIITDATIANASLTGGTSIIGYIAEAGEILSVHSSGNNGLTAYFRVVEYDSTCAVYSSKLTSLSAGNNTVYTVPSSKTAVLVDNNGQLNTNNGTLNYCNSSGGARTITWNLVPNGSSVSTNNRIIATGTSVADGSRNSGSFAASMGTGDFINLTTDAATANQIAWVNVMEI